MLKDERAETLATRFASLWLRLQDLDKIHPDALTFPRFDHSLAESMKRETELLFDTLIREDRSMLELLTADWTFVNERLARHYGIPNITGPEFRRVAGGRREPPRPARPRQHPDDDVGRRSHLAGAARQVGDGSAAGVAAAAAAAQRAAARGNRRCGRCAAAVGARAHGAAPLESAVHVVPPGDRPARPGAREFRRHRRSGASRTTA